MAGRLIAGVALGLLTGAAALAHDAPVILGAFRNGDHDGRIALASGFVCPERIGPYIRDAVGQSGPNEQAVFCSYYALDGIYGTVRILPLDGRFDGPASLASQFALQTGSGAKVVAQATATVAGKGTTPAVYSRTYETSRLETLHYRVRYSSAPVRGWVVQVISEYAAPRDDATRNLFLNWAYGPALAALRTRSPAVAQMATK
ncbi:MAG: hypothetical protein KGO02_12610 [Alphaproteobacteria bacterium]|nr:hypothetical protein [Alphaproteobacteria bacterium]